MKKVAIILLTSLLSISAIAQLQFNFIEIPAQPTITPYSGSIDQEGGSSESSTIQSLTANGSATDITVTSGDTVTISWTSNDTGVLTLNGVDVYDALALDFTESFTPSVDTTYTLDNGTDTSSINVIVVGPTAPGQVAQLVITFTGYDGIILGGLEFIDENDAYLPLGNEILNSASVYQTDLMTVTTNDKHSNISYYFAKYLMQSRHHPTDAGVWGAVWLSSNTVTPTITVDFAIPEDLNAIRFSPSSLSSYSNATGFIVDVYDSSAGLIKTITVPFIFQPVASDRMYKLDLATGAFTQEADSMVFGNY